MKKLLASLLALICLAVPSMAQTGTRYQQYPYTNAVQSNDVLLFVVYLGGPQGGTNYTSRDITFGNLINSPLFSNYIASFGAAFLQSANNLGDVSSAATSRANLGLASLATSNAITLANITNLNLPVAAGLQYTNDTMGLGEARFAVTIGASYFYDPQDGGVSQNWGMTPTGTNALDPAATYLYGPTNFIATQSYITFFDNIALTGSVLDTLYGETNTNYGIWQGVFNGNGNGNFNGTYTGGPYTNVDPGATSLNDFPTVAAAASAWASRGGSLYVPNGIYEVSNSITLATGIPDQYYLYGGLAIRGNALGSSILDWAGGNGPMLTNSQSANYGKATDFHNVTLRNLTANTNVQGYMQWDGGTGPIYWDNVVLKGFRTGAQVYNSGGFMYDISLDTCGLGLSLAPLSDAFDLTWRGWFNTNAGVANDSRGNRFFGFTQDDQIGLLIGNGGGTWVQMVSEGASNGAIVIGYPPASQYPQTNTGNTGTMGGVHFGYGYSYDASSNAMSGGLPAYVKLYRYAQGLQGEDMWFGGTGIISTTNVADATPIELNAVVMGTGSNLVQFSDGSIIPPTGVSESNHYHINQTQLGYFRATNTWKIDTLGNSTWASVTTTGAGFTGNGAGITNLPLSFSGTSGTSTTINANSIRYFGLAPMTILDGSAVEANASSTLGLNGTYVITNIVLGENVGVISNGASLWFRIVTNGVLNAPMQLPGSANSKYVLPVTNSFVVVDPGTNFWSMGVSNSAGATTASACIWWSFQAFRIQ